MSRLICRAAYILSSLMCWAAHILSRSCTEPLCAEPLCAEPLMWPPFGRLRAPLPTRLECRSNEYQSNGVAHENVTANSSAVSLFGRLHARCFVDVVAGGRQRYQDR